MRLKKATNRNIVDALLSAIEITVIGYYLRLAVTKARY